ncbi:hypothetical protein Bpfe_030377 [Biomphalaria pfeifferi]|uniref:Uncharacterized protein n=1 Tax=Biomphalaria pfeifferi TaxID=112525 RepID=A0AAD8APW1_BIOPF|nr:hypothetical protein Bpfe_030377 [Biomphalaria pfeifferi]
MTATRGLVDVQLLSGGHSGACRCSTAVWRPLWGLQRVSCCLAAILAYRKLTVALRPLGLVKDQLLSDGHSESQLLSGGQSGLAKGQLLSDIALFPLFNGQNVLQ